jgi:hypothetical protein
MTQRQESAVIKIDPNIYGAFVEPKYTVVYGSIYYPSSPLADRNIKLVASGASNYTPLVEVKIPESTGWNTVDTPLLKFQKGIHNLVVVLKDNNPVEIDWIKFIN